MKTINKPVLVKIQHKEFNVHQFTTSENKTFRIYEQGSEGAFILGIKDMTTKVIHTLSNPFYAKLYKEVKGNFFKASGKYIMTNN